VSGSLAQTARYGWGSSAGRPTAPEGYDIGGVSGGPLMTMVDSANLCYWRLGGVMTEFSTSLEIFYATRADFILSNGTLKSAKI
jgi:hypothetical protein